MRSSSDLSGDRIPDVIHAGKVPEGQLCMEEPCVDGAAVNHDSNPFAIVYLFRAGFAVNGMYHRVLAVTLNLADSAVEGTGITPIVDESECHLILF